MTMPKERTRAVLQTREFLHALTNPARTPGVPENVRQHAITLHRHYPDAAEMAITGEACLAWFAIPE